MRVLLAFGLVFGLAGFAAAADDKKPVEKKPEDKKPEDKKAADPTGTWKWETEFGGQKRTNTLKLKLEKEKLTGAMVGQDGKETEIKDATFKDGEANFTVERERDGQKFSIKYKAKVEGDTLKGTATFGEDRKIEFEGKREKEDKKEEKKSDKKDQ
jgi:hypothetical protein